MKLRSVPLIQPSLQYLREVRHELTQVSWPSRQQTLQKTVVVIVVSILIGLFVGGLDLIFTRLVQLVLS